MVQSDQEARATVSSQEPRSRWQHHPSSLVKRSSLGVTSLFVTFHIQSDAGPSFHHHYMSSSSPDPKSAGRRLFLHSVSDPSRSSHNRCTGVPERRGAFDTLSLLPHSPRSDSTLCHPDSSRLVALSHTICLVQAHSAELDYIN